MIENIHTLCWEVVHLKFIVVWDIAIIFKYVITLSKFWVYHKKNGTKVFMLKMWSLIYVKMIFNDFEIICWEILELFTDKVD